MSKASKQETDIKSPAKEAASVSRKVMNTIRELQGKNGVALREIKMYLQDHKKMNIKEAGEHIKMAIQKNMKKGVLVREDGLYKVKNSHQATAKRQASQAKTPAKAKKTHFSFSPSEKVQPKARKVAKETATSAKSDLSVVKHPRVGKAKAQVAAELPELPSSASVVSTEPMETFRNGADSSGFGIAIDA